MADLNSLKKKKKKKAGRAQTVEEIFASVSTISASGPNPPPQRVVLSPRSAEACLKHGINPESLRIRDLDSFREPSIDPAVQRMRHEAYSQRRHEYMKIVRAARKKLYAQDGASISKSRSITHAGKGAQEHPSSMIDVEKRRLQKIQQRQQKEIENMLQFELKMNAVAEEANRKLEAEKRKEEKAEREKLKRQKRMAEERRIRDLKKKAQEDAEEEKREAAAYAMFLKDKEQAEAQSRKERLREIEARKREEDRNRKAEEYREQTAGILKQQQDAIMRRLEEMDKAEQVRNKLIMEQRKSHRKKLQLKRKAVEKRISKNLKNARSIERKRREDFELKQVQVAEQRHRLESAAEKERQLARKQQELLARKRQMVLEEAKYEEEMRKEELLAHQDAMEENLRRIQAGHQRERELKKEVKLLNHAIKQDNVERMKRVDEYNRLETIRRLKESEERTERLLHKKQAIIQQRKQAAIKSKIQRDQIVTAMEKVKISKKWGQASKVLNSAMRLDGGESVSSKSLGHSKSSPSMATSMSNKDSLPDFGHRSNDNLPPSVSADVANRVRQKTKNESDYAPTQYVSPYSDDNGAPIVTV